jgi:hypothetical protein
MANPPATDMANDAIAPEFAPSPRPVVTDDDIRRRAYELFEQRNGGEGDHVNDWLTAERELKSLSSI